MWMVILFAGYAVWRYRTADIEYLARQEFMLVAITAVVVLAIVDNLHGQTELRILAIALTTLGTLVAMYGIYQWLTGSPHVWHFVRPAYEGRASGTYICPNHFAGLLEMICPIAMAFAVLRGFRPVPRILFAYASLVMLAGIAVSGSRGGWLSTAIAVIVLSGALIRKKNQILGALVLLLVVGGTGKWFYSRVLAPRIHHPESQNWDNIRLRLWKPARSLWLEQPWFGVGPNHFDYRYRAYRLAHWEVQPRPGHAHNDYWNTLADWGLVGLVLVLAPIVVTAVGLVRIWPNLHRRGETAGSRAALVLGASIGIVAILVHSFFDFNIHIPGNALIAGALLAIVASHWRFASQQYWISAGWALRGFVTLVMATAGVYLATQALRHTREIMVLREAERLPPASQEKAAALQKAVNVEPKNPETALAMGDQLWMRAMAGEPDYKQEAIDALSWFQRAMELNRWDPQARIRAGMCLDWLDRPAEAEDYFMKALQLDPNHWQTRAMMGWHYFQTEDYAKAVHWMERSLEVEGRNTLALSYLPLAKKMLAAPPSAPASK